MAKTAVLTRQVWPIGRHRRCSTEVPRSFRVCSDGGHTVHSDVRLRRHTIVCGRRLGLEVNLLRKDAEGSAGVACDDRTLGSHRCNEEAVGESRFDFLPPNGL